jgi:hypothetical protein
VHKATQYYGDKYGLSGSHLAINYQLATLLNTSSAAAMTGRHLESSVRSWIDSMPSGATANWLVCDVINCFRLRGIDNSYEAYDETCSAFALTATGCDLSCGKIERANYNTNGERQATIGGKAPERFYFIDIMLALHKQRRALILSVYITAKNFSTS